MCALPICALMFALLWLAAQWIAPLPPAAPAASEAAAPPPVAEADVRVYAAIVGRKAVGKPVTGPFGTADKVLVLARDDKGYPIVGASFGYPVRDSLPPPPGGARKSVVQGTSVSVRVDLGRSRIFQKKTTHQQANTIMRR